MSTADYFRYTPVGHLIRAVSGDRILPHSKTNILNRAAAVKEVVTSTDEAVNGQDERGEPDKDTYVVVWESKDDPMNPKNFPTPAKILIGIQV